MILVGSCIMIWGWLRRLHTMGVASSGESIGGLGRPGRSACRAAQLPDVCNKVGDTT